MNHPQLLSLAPLCFLSFLVKSDLIGLATFALCIARAFNERTPRYASYAAHLALPLAFLYAAPSTLRKADILAIIVFFAIAGMHYMDYVIPILYAFTFVWVANHASLPIKVWAVWGVYATLWSLAKFYNQDVWLFANVAGAYAFYTLLLHTNMLK